ncbi:gamma-glutamyltranspeptidase/glutathione hydrolase [Breoghania corrubedonensis]|uniref:Gamma-glutamyltranspeptidase/glutathione hydrolase n=1 Tax=Breoghania corrubedonensis TaxID=665038 RepID=A0A2T5V8W6_9HYPH|nr:gamma-glutamyltransferase family protein [Breoghania corrubedonensis]PTW60198.1 gamma-glutamyltranspeptidase/glutathione hydrolase [Breoghania corrubedonensis]
MLLRHDPIYPSRRSPVLADNVVATSQPLATQAGITILQQGGNAVDAAIAVAATLTVVEPTGNGLGSDGFCILWDGKQLHGLNASGPAPAAWAPERFPNGIPLHGWDSVTVPGAVGAWVELSERFGKLGLATVLAPAIRYAEDGFTVSPVIGALWAKGAQSLSAQPGFAETFMPDGRAPKAGERFRNPGAARTLRAIADTRGRAFYEGEIAEAIAAFSKANGGAMTVADLAGYRPEWCGTISQRFDDVALHEIPPNGQGVAALMALGILQHTSIRDRGPDDLASVHLQIEAIKLAYRDLHAFVADRKYMTGVSEEALLDPDYLKSRAALIDPDKAQDFGAGAPKRGGTVLMSVADASGMMVSFIQSNYMGFGSGVVVPGYGISMQNRGVGFTTEKGHPNCVAGGKRPFHTIIPGFAMKGEEPLMAYGMMGGPIQAQGHMQLLLRTQLWNQDVQSAADAPRWRAIEGLDVACEPTMAPQVLRGLVDLGHKIQVEAPDNAFGFGGAQLVQRLPDGGYAAGSDPRKDGHAAGF